MLPGALNVNIVKGHRLTVCILFPLKWDVTDWPHMFGS